MVTDIFLLFLKKYSSFSIVSLSSSFMTILVFSFSPSQFENIMNYNSVKGMLEIFQNCVTGKGYQKARA